MQAGKLDAVRVILDGNKADAKQFAKKKFSFKWLAKLIIKRQLEGKDCIIIVSGDRRMGKSTWALKLIRQYIKLRREQDPKFKWSWKTNFPITRAQAQETAAVLGLRSFIQYDEGGDQFYRQETNKKAQRDLIKFMNKSGVKGHLTIIIWPDVFTLDPKLLNMAQLLVLVPYRTSSGKYINNKGEAVDDPNWPGCAWAFLYGRSNNPFNYDKFGIEKIRKKMASPTKSGVKMHIPMLDGRFSVQEQGRELTVTYPKALFKFLRTIPTFMKSHRFGPLDKTFEARYIKYVKDPQLMAHTDDDYVSQAQYDKLMLQYKTLLYNLYTRDDKSYAQLERLHISPIDGLHLKSVSAIRAMIESIKAMT